MTLAQKVNYAINVCTSYISLLAEDNMNQVQKMAYDSYIRDKWFLEGLSEEFELSDTDVIESVLERFNCV